jgi:lipopolysaccharide transport system ATP-binding protein
MASIIKVDNLSKAYQLGQFSTGTLSRDLERWWADIRGKEDPFLKIGETNYRDQKGTSDIVWSLKDISFEIEQGDAVAIIGKNGAGKSTLLKILSQVTSPTSGSIKIKGRMASLLEVGTGFHPELTGRENVFLNGAILGMRKKEITRKFDEIVDFSGVERYIDTPVKRYSSGMYVRLAFAVAAHLESEILIVDEVLAVGDADFQKKCMGKMGDISKGDGRTILFVSHNMTSVAKLCTQGILLKDGKIDFTGHIDKTVDRYLNENDFRLALDKQLSGSFSLKDVVLVNRNNEEVYNFDINQEVGIRMVISVNDDKHRSFFCGVNLYGDYAKALITTAEYIDGFAGKDTITVTCWLPKHVFTADQQLRIRLNAATIEGDKTTLHYDFPELMLLNLVEPDREKRILQLKSKLHSMLSPKFEWDKD